jgi:hypothetical protein
MRVKILKASMYNVTMSFSNRLFNFGLNKNVETYSTS